MSEEDTADIDWIVKEEATSRSGAPDSPPATVPGGNGSVAVDHVGVHALVTDVGELETDALTVGVAAPVLAHAATSAPAAAQEVRKTQVSFASALSLSDPPKSTSSCRVAS